MKNPAFTILLAIFILAGTGFTQKDALSADESAIAANIKLLHSENGEIRSSAAKELRSIIAKYSSGTSNIRDKDGGEAFWMQKVNQIVPSMVKAEVVKVLPPFQQSLENMTAGSGQSHSDYYRLDDIWMIRIAYYNPDVVIKVPDLVKRQRAIYVEPPKNFTGIWIGWHVNGQKANEIQFNEGKYDGVFTSFHDNGQKLFEQHYVHHEANGSDTGWYPDGKIMYTGQYGNGKQDGKWIHLFPDGSKSSESNFKNGLRHGLHAGWYENGQMRFEMNYLGGIQNGIEAAWNEHGVLQYRRECKDGKVVQ